MIASLLAASAMVLVPYEPHIDCAKPISGNPIFTYVDVANGTDIRWNGRLISRALFDSYVEQERAIVAQERTKSKDRDIFRVYRDTASGKLANNIVQELSRADIPFGKNCLPIP